MINIQQECSVNHLDPRLQQALKQLISNDEKVLYCRREVIENNLNADLITDIRIIRAHVENESFISKLGFNLQVQQMVPRIPQKV